MTEPKHRFAVGYFITVTGTTDTEYGASQEQSQTQIIEGMALKGRPMCIKHVEPPFIIADVLSCDQTRPHLLAMMGIQSTQAAIIDTRNVEVMCVTDEFVSAIIGEDTLRKVKEAYKRAANG